MTPTHSARFNHAGTTLTVQFVAHLDGPQIVQIVDRNDLPVAAYDYTSGVYCAAEDAAVAAYADLA